VWDWLMLRWLKNTHGQEVNIDEIQIGNRWVNKPSFFTSLFVLFLLSVHSILPFRHRVEDVIADSYGSDGIKLVTAKTQPLIKLEEEMLVVGLVSFHLFVSALTYFFATSRPEPGSKAVSLLPKRGGAELAAIFAAIRENLRQIEDRVRPPPP
jgi:hypothetical protein